jgi:hypothetical protein
MEASGDEIYILLLAIRPAGDEIYILWKSPVMKFTYYKLAIW